MSIGTAFFIGLISGVLLLILLLLGGGYLAAKRNGYDSIKEWLDDQ
jgi:hypothetical protein